MLLRGYIPFSETQKYNNDQDHKIKSVDKRFEYRQKKVLEGQLEGL